MSAAAIAGLMAGGSAGAAELPEIMSFSEDGTQLLQGRKAATGLYDQAMLRTIHLEFKQADWWQQMTANYRAAVDIPADLTMDGITYRDVGVRFKGMTSYGMTGASQKKSFNISIDYKNPDQRLMGYRTLNLNNAAQDPTFMKERLYFDTMRRYAPVPKTSFVKLVINGENWGVYVHVQQLNADMIEEWFLDNNGNRWKAGGGAVGGGPGPGGTQPPPTGTQPPPTGTQPFPRGTQPPPTGTQPPPTGTQAPPAQTTPPPTGTQPPPTVTPPGGRPPGGGGGGFAASGGSALTWLGSDSTAYKNQYELKSANTPDPWGLLMRACNVLNNTPQAQLADSVETVLAVDRWLWWLAVENVFTDEDSYLSKGWDYQLYYDAVTGQIHPLEHDGNEALGAGGGGAAPPPTGTQPAPTGTQAPPAQTTPPPTGTQPAPTGTQAPPTQTTPPPTGTQPGPTGQAPGTRGVQQSPVEGEGNANRPVISKLLAIPHLRQRYLAHMRTILNESFDLRVLTPKMEQYRALIESEVRADTKKLYSNDQFVSGLSTVQGFVTSRRTFLLGHAEINRPAPEIVSVIRKTGTGDNGAVAAGQSVQVAAKVGGGVGAGEVILYHADGVMGRFKRVSMLDDGAHGDERPGDGVYGAEIPPYPAGSLVRYYVEARAKEGVGTAAFAPAGAEHEVFVYRVSNLTSNLVKAGSTPVVINEFMAANTATVKDPQGEYDDWIELLNVSGQEVDLSGMYLSDSENNLKKWVFPEGTRLAPGAYLIVWADENGKANPGLHANFKLSASGESVLLVDRDARGNLVLDAVQFGEQKPDVSAGRSPDGMGEFQALSRPTPGARNVSAAVSSDFNGSGKVDFDDFFLFAAAFAKRQGSSGYESRFDLDSDGEVGFSDFFIFASDFGR